jgi:hypothetical protein
MTMKDRSYTQQLAFSWNGVFGCAKTISTLVVAVAAFVTAVLPFSPAMAAGSSLACNISPGNGTFDQGFCGSGVASFSYTITYLVKGVTGSATYSWAPPGGLITSGCTSTSDDCAISVAQGRRDKDRTETVVVTQGGTHTTLSATAETEAVCAGPFGPVFC